MNTNITKILFGSVHQWLSPLKTNKINTLKTNTFRISAPVALLFASSPITHSEATLAQKISFTVNNNFLCT
jgi:hypothetical protein